jgi:hypothetical protein
MGLSSSSSRFESPWRYSESSLRQRAFAYLGPLALKSCRLGHRVRIIAMHVATAALDADLDALTDGNEDHSLVDR